MKRVAVILCLCALPTTGLATDWFRDLPPDPLPVTDSQFLRNVVLLRSVGRYDDALAAIREFETRANRSGDTHVRQVAKDYIAALEPIVALPPALRRRAATADSLAVLVKLAWTEGRYGEGTSLCGRCLELRREVLGPRHPDVALSLHDLGTFHAVRGHLAESEALLREALRLRMVIHGPRHHGVAETLRFLGEVLFEDGRYEEAQDFLVRALELRRATMGDVNEYVRRDLLEIAQIHIHLGNLAAAEPLLGLALRQNRDHRGEHHWLNATLLANLALIAEKKGDLEEAERVRRQVLTIRRAVLSPDHPHIARSLVNLGRIHTLRGNYARADTCLQESLALAQRYRAGDSPEFVTCLKALAEHREALSSYAEARSYRLQALEVDRRRFGERHADVAGSMVALARLWRREGRLSAADSAVTVAIRVLEETLGRNHPVLIDAWTEAALIRLDSADPSAAEKYLAAAARNFESARLRVGDNYERAFFSRSPYGLLAGVRLVLGLEHQAWNAAEMSFGRTLSDLLGTRRTETPIPKTLASGSDLLLTLPGAATRPVGLERTHAALEPGMALVGMVEALPGAERRGPWTFVIRADAPLTWIEHESTAEPATDGAILAKELNVAASWPFRVTDTERVAAAAHDLWRQWFAPLDQHLAGIERLLVIPSGPLKAVPVEVLVDDQGRHLIDRFCISYTPSATVLVNLRTAAVGDGRSRTGPLLVGSSTGGASELPDLPGAQREIMTVAGIYPGAVSLSGAESDEAALHDQASRGELAAFDIVHFATHALIDDDRPTDSCLVLSQRGLADTLAAACSRGTVNDGYLTAGEIERAWQLDADLVTLSGCRSARGRVADGEGHIGLAHAFLRAGARRLLVSLWDVEDEATELLMSRFYTNLRDHANAASGAAALRDAKIWLRQYRDSAGRAPYRHPAYWSAFVLIGDS